MVGKLLSVTIHNDKQSVLENSLFVERDFSWLVKYPTNILKRISIFDFLRNYKHRIKTCYEFEFEKGSFSILEIDSDCFFANGDGLVKPDDVYPFLLETLPIVEDIKLLSCLKDLDKIEV